MIWLATLILDGPEKSKPEIKTTFMAEHPIAFVLNQNKQRLGHTSERYSIAWYKKMDEDEASMLMENNVFIQGGSYEEEGNKKNSDQKS